MATQSAAPPPRETRLDAIARVEARREEFVERLLSHLGDKTPELIEDAELSETWRELSVANLDAALATARRNLESGVPTGPDGEPGKAAENARLMARRGIRLEFLLHGYRCAHCIAWDMVTDEILASGFDHAVLTAWLNAGSHFMFDYFDHMIAVVTKAYTEETERRLRGTEQRRTRAVSQVLEGEPASSDELGYRLEGHHLAMVLRGAAAESAARAIAATTGYEALIISQTDGLAWLWLGSRERFDDRVWKKVEPAITPGVRVAAGNCDSGSAGFRLSHRQALTADRVAETSARPLTRYAEIALVAAVLEHDTARASFVGSFLGELAQPGRRNATLRATLEAYFAAGQNAASASAALGVSARTVRNRLRLIEDLVGHRIDVRRAELEVALRMVDGAAGRGATAL